MHFLRILQVTSRLVIIHSIILLKGYSICRTVYLCCEGLILACARQFRSEIITRCRGRGRSAVTVDPARTDTSSAADLGSETFWKNAKSIVALRDSITVQSLAVPSGKKLYLPAGITLNVVDGSYTGTVYGPVCCGPRCRSDARGCRPM